MEYSTSQAVLLIIFNRPDTTRQVFEAIRSVKPPRLYVAADGPRHGRTGEDATCRQAREITNGVDWDCQVFTLYRAENLGCKYAVSSAIIWFFEHEPEGIILEDDCLPHWSFFKFCDELLMLYREDSRVMAICGANFQRNRWHPLESYYFSRNTHVWGWASWRRAWCSYDVEMLGWPDFVSNNKLHDTFPESWAPRFFWTKILSDVAAGQVDTWDYQWTYTIWRHGGISILPAINLVKNIGFDADATHTKHAEPWLLEMNAEEMVFPLIHPATVTACIEADRRYERTVLNIRPIRMARKKLKSWIRAKIGNALHCISGGKK